MQPACNLLALPLVAPLVGTASLESRGLQATASVGYNVQLSGHLWSRLEAFAQHFLLDSWIKSTAYLTIFKLVDSAQSFLALEP
jgi:hypothetical protein